MISPADVSAILNVIQQQNQNHWMVSYVEEKKFWKMKYSGTTPGCELYVEFNGPSLCLQIELGEIRLKPQCRTALYFFLLRLNEDLPVVKFGLQESGKITLMAESMTSQVSLSTLEELVQALVAVFVQYRREIELLAVDPVLADIVLKSNDVPTRPAVNITVVDRESVRPSTQP